MASEHPEREKSDFYRYWVEEEVRFHDLDAYSHVNNNVIGIYFETARMRNLEDLHPHGWKTDAHFVLLKNSITFLNELNYPNHIRIGQRVVKIGTSSMTSAGGIFLGEKCIAVCETVSVWINNKTRRPEAIPDTMRAALESAS
jgi:acyl-CoA thioester hydrolase